MSASLPDAQKLFGLFELDHLGTVLYLRKEPDGTTTVAEANLVGRNFFDEVAPFSNAESLRQRICDFNLGDGQADKFLFTCQCDEGPLQVKILLARIRARSNGNDTKSILMHIRKA